MGYSQRWPRCVWRTRSWCYRQPAAGPPAWAPPATPARPAPPGTRTRQFLWERERRWWGEAARRECRNTIRKQDTSKDLITQVNKQHCWWHLPLLLTWLPTPSIAKQKFCPTQFKKTKVVSRFYMSTKCSSWNIMETLWNIQLHVCYWQAWVTEATPQMRVRSFIPVAYETMTKEINHNGKS